MSTAGDALTYAYISIYSQGMARAATTFDPFNAIAEAKRRRVLETLAGGERAVNDLAATLRWTQPQVSKHLSVLKSVGLVTVRQAGRQRLYALNPRQLQQIYDWVRGFEKFWDHHLHAIKARAESKQDQTQQPQTTEANDVTSKFR